MSQNEIATVELGKAKQKFSSGHFTMFSPTERENLHGHNFHVRVIFHAEVGPAGICFDLQLLKDAITELCSEWNERVLLPTRSPWLRIEDDPGAPYLLAVFGDERIPFLRRDVMLIPARNGSLEEIASVFVDRLIGNTDTTGDTEMTGDTETTGDDGWAALGLHDITVMISTEPDQYAGVTRSFR